jgi:hypothetical protein
LQPDGFLACQRGGAGVEGDLLRCGRHLVLPARLLSWLLHALRWERLLVASACCCVGKRTRILAGGLPLQIRLTSGILAAAAVQLSHRSLLLMASCWLLVWGLLAAEKARELGAVVSQLPLQGCSAICLLPVHCSAVPTCSPLVITPR